jgi:hypothetical protein
MADHLNSCINEPQRQSPHEHIARNGNSAGTGGIRPSRQLNSISNRAACLREE